MKRISKNTVFCYSSKRYKMLFESQSKADNFIRYNGEEILREHGKAPVRSYYCQMCGGWHVTSNPSKVIGNSLDMRDDSRIKRLNLYTKTVERVKAVTAVLIERIEKIIGLLASMKIKDAEDLLEICDLDLEELHSYAHILRSTAKTMTLQKRVNMLHKMIETAKK